jgi:hypothetical protein
MKPVVSKLKTKCNIVMTHQEILKKVEWKDLSQLSVAKK